MKDHINEIIIVMGGLLTTFSAWKLGGRQKAKNSKDDTLTVGADKVVDTALKLLDRINGLLDDEQAQRKSCEEELKAVYTKIHELEEMITK